MKTKKNLKISSSNCENVPLMFKIDACIELVQTKFMDYSPIKKDLFYNYSILLEIVSYFAKFYNSVTNIENCAIFYSTNCPNTAIITTFKQTFLLVYIEALIKASMPFKDSTNYEFT